MSDIQEMPRLRATASGAQRWVFTREFVPPCTIHTQQTWVSVVSQETTGHEKCWAHRLPEIQHP